MDVEDFRCDARPHRERTTTLEEKAHSGNRINPQPDPGFKKQDRGQLTPHSWTWHKEKTKTLPNRH